MFANGTASNGLLHVEADTFVEVGQKNKIYNSFHCFIDNCLADQMCDANECFDSVNVGTKRNRNDSKTSQEKR